MDKNKFIMSYSVDKTFDSDKFIKIRCRVCHDDESPNKTYFTKETMEHANKQSLEYIPILAHVYYDEKGKPTIGAHDIHIEEDRLNEGMSRIIYDEQPIGVVPSLRDNNCAIEEYNGLNYTFVDAYVWRDYSNYAEQLIEDAENTKLSMEIDFPEEALSYDAANDRYNISSYRYRGITLLNETLGTGMKDALATTTNFSANDEVKSRMIVLMEELTQCLRDYNKDNSHEEGGRADMANGESVEVAMEEVTIEGEETNSEVEVVMEEEAQTLEEVVEENAEEEVVEEITDTEEFSENEPMVCTFRISHDDIRFGIQSLLNAMCDDNHFFYVESVFDKYFYYTDYCSGNSYIQKYKTRKDVISFDGDPEAVYREFVTQSEREELENMRKNYVALVEFKEQIEAEKVQATKDAVFSKAEFEIIKESKLFKSLVAASKDYTVEECEQKANDILEDFQTFATQNANTQVKTIGFNFAQGEEIKKPYGGLFDK